MTKTDAGINDAGRKTQEDFFNNILPLILLQGFERVVQGLHVRGSWRPNVNCNILTPTVMTVTLCLSCSLVLFNRRPRTHCLMLAFFIASYQHLLWTPNSIGVSEGLLGRVWLPLPHLVSSLLDSPGNCFLDSNSTELNNNSTPTRSPTGSLKSNV